MLALSSSFETTIALIVATVVGACILGMGRAAMKLLQSRQTQRRNDDADQHTLSAFLFDQPRNERTGTPATQGWTTKVDRTLGVLESGQHQTTQMVSEILSEIRPDGNGGHNLRGIIERGAEAAGAEVVMQTKERARVQHRDQRLEHA